MKPLNLCGLKDGQSAKISEIHGGRHIRQRLASMGVHPGDSIRVLRAPRFMGPVLIEIHGSEVAIGFGMAHRIRVEPAVSP